MWILGLFVLFQSCCAWVATPQNSKTAGRSISITSFAPGRPNAIINRYRDNVIRLFESSSPAVCAPLSPPPPGTVTALSSLAQTILCLLSGDEAQGRTLCWSAGRKRELIEEIFNSYDTCESGTLSVEEARALFIDLSRSIVTEIAGKDSASSNSTNAGIFTMGQVARSHARRVLDEDEKGTNTIERVATKLLILADKNHDGRVNLRELAEMFDTLQAAPKIETFPQPLRALAGSLQLLPPTEGKQVAEAASIASDWHVGVPGDDHTLRRVELEKGLSLVGLGRSADASAYFLPELGMVLDAGFHVKSLLPKTVLLTHGHRDHIGALAVHAQSKAKILAPQKISKLVRKFLIAEAQLNYGNQDQTDEETIEALGEFDILPVSDGDEILLPKSSYTGSPKPLGVEVFEAPHKNGVPAVSYGLYQSKTRLKEEYA